MGVEVGHDDGERAAPLAALDHSVDEFCGEEVGADDRVGAILDDEPPHAREREALQRAARATAFGRVARAI